MKQIDRHETKHQSYQGDYAWFRESRARFITNAARKWTDCEGVVDNYQLDARRFAASGDGVMAKEALVASLDIAVAGFLGSGGGELREQRVLGEMLTRATSAPATGQSPGCWLLAHATAVALRRRDALASLLACPEGAFDSRYIRSGHPDYDVVRAIQAIHRGEVNWHDHLRRAEAKFEPTTYGTPAQVRLERAILRLLDVSHSGQQEAFTDALFEAVKQHKAYWSVGSNRTSAEGLLNIRIAGYAAIGVDRGLRLEVESEYIPAWLVLGTEPPLRKSPIPQTPPKKPSTKKRAR